MGASENLEKYNEGLKKSSRSGKGKAIVFYEDIGGCHICTSHYCNNRGYPIITYFGRHLNVARLVYERSKGTIPEGLLLRHVCDNRKCINPDHLIPGTVKDNSRDMVVRGRADHPFGEKNPNHRLTESQIFEIVSHLKSGIPHKEIAHRYSIAERTVRDIKCGNRWNDVTKLKKGVTRL